VVLVAGAQRPEDAGVASLLRSCPDLPILRLNSLGERPSLWRGPRTLAVLSAALRRLRPTVIHTHSGHGARLVNLATRLAGGAGTARRGGKSLVVHTLYGLPDAGDPRFRGGTRRGGASPSGPASLLLTASPRLAAELEERLGGGSAVESVVVNPPGLWRAEGPRAAARLEELAPPGARERTVAMSGCGVDRHGLTALARAHAGLDRLRRARLRVLVFGPLEESARAALIGAIREGGVAQRWIFPAQVPDPRSLATVADAVASVATEEETPVNLIEALGEGLPVIAEATPGAEELVRCDWTRLSPGRWRTAPASPRGLLVSPSDPDNWRSALATLIDEPSSLPGQPDERRSFVAGVFDADARSADLCRLYSLPERSPRRSSSREQRGTARGHDLPAV
jgi:glycosyltransferase involved in cell wall biosynthesis